MKRLLGIVVLLMCIAVPVSAQTQFGLGWDNGYSFRINGDSFSVQLTGRFDSAIPEDDDLDSETDGEVTIYAMYPFMQLDQAKFNVFGGFSLLPSTREITAGAATYDKEIDFAFRVGVEPHAMVTDHIGLSGKIGLQVLLNQGYDGLDDSGETDVGAWGSIGVHWFF